ncbi:MAG TPA: hypothetical protein H9860_03335 [Candidatus Gemmiger faecavium]|nr:hypothetical protein [Candidatus Gemmiger faecavium]
MAKSLLIQNQKGGRTGISGRLSALALPKGGRGTGFFLSRPASTVYAIIFTIQIDWIA